MEMKIGRRKQDREPPRSYMESDLCGYTPYMEIVYLVLVAEGAVLSDGFHHVLTDYCFDFRLQR